MPPFFVLLLDPANTGGLARRCCTSILSLQSQTILITLTVLLSVVPAFALPAAGTRTQATAAFSVPASEVGDAASYYV